MGATMSKASDFREHVLAQLATCEVLTSAELARISEQTMGHNDVAKIASNCEKLERAGHCTCEYGRAGYILKVTHGRYSDSAY